MKYENSQQKIDVLKTVYGTMHEHIRANEAFENRVAFSVGTLFILFTAFVLREHLNPDQIEKSIIALMIFAIAVVTIIFLMNNNKRIKAQCRIVVRIEKTLGLYEPNYFIDDIHESERRCIPPQVFPNEAMDWGDKKNRLLLLPHILGVAFAASAAIASIFVQLPKLNDNERPESHMKSVIMPHNSQYQNRQK
jgi:hypothetical protein